MWAELARAELVLGRVVRNSVKALICVRHFNLSVRLRFGVYVKWPLASM